MKQIYHPERSAAESKDLRISGHICSIIGAKILRLVSLAQDDKLADCAFVWNRAVFFCSGEGMPSPYNMMFIHLQKL